MYQTVSFPFSHAHIYIFKVWLTISTTLSCLHCLNHLFHRLAFRCEVILASARGTLLPTQFLVQNWYSFLGFGFLNKFFCFSNDLVCLTAMTESSCLCGMMQSPVARHRLFQQQPSWPKAALPPWLWTWLTWRDHFQSCSGSQQQTQEFFSYQNEFSKLTYFHNRHSTHPTLSKSSAFIDTQTFWNVHIGASGMNAN